MVPNWKSWCRLCAREDPTYTHININLETKLGSVYLDAINKHFSIDINLDDWPQNICTQCHQYVTDFINFVGKTSKVQSMFAEIVNNPENLDFKQLRSKYELQELRGVKLKVIDPKPNLGEFEFIDEEMLNLQNIKTENIEKEDSIISDKEWKAELDDNSSDDDESVMASTKCKENTNQKSKKRPKFKPRERTRNELENFACSSCQKRFCSYPVYALHIQNDHGVTEEKFFSTQKACDIQEIINQSDEKKLTSCPYCNKEFKTSKLRVHIQEIHVGEKSFVCDDCGKAYTTFGNLKEHKMTHSEDRPFKCRYCEKDFKSKRRLLIHEDTHNETNYICTSCGLQLNTRRTLNMHMLVHSDQKRHKCNFCGNEFKRSKALKDHLILHTGLKPYTCNFCERTFANAANCRSHKKRNHPIELAAMEASGGKVINHTIPKLEQLRAAISNHSNNS